ncbi:MAG: hypothetical protein M3Z14_01590 [Candidatus Eremiobacteraeota bacterium]|nr:hypothetical protein [Candidatus Eremiobacteraeota bacterium]
MAPAAHGDCALKFYDFVDKAPAIGNLVIIEGTERTLAERALDIVMERTVPADVRDLNLERLSAPDMESTARVAEATQAMPFLAATRLVIVTDTQTLRAAARRELWQVAQSVPTGNTLVLLDLLSPKAMRPQAFGQLAGKKALCIDTSLSEAVRVRYIRELLAELGVQAEGRVIDELSRSNAELAAVRSDLEKLSLTGKRIGFKDLERESLAIEDPKAYRYASALIEGKAAQALQLASEMFANDPRGAAIPLVAALASEYALIWEVARPGGDLPARAKWRERFLRPLARRIGEERARAGFERAVRGFESIVTGTIDQPRLLVEMLTAELAAL